MSRQFTPKSKTKCFNIKLCNLFKKCLLPTYVSIQILHLAAILKENSGIFKPRPYFWHEIRSSTHREQFGESRRPSEDI